MKFNIKKTTEFCVGSLLAGLSWAHPGLSPQDKASPCPFLDQKRHHERRLGGEEGAWQQPPPMRALGRTGDGGVPEGGFQAVKMDLEALMTDSQDFWPADPGFKGPNYGGLFIRLAWHCAGSYRRSDGRGGCDGGRIRFDPELNWMDNGNLDMALKLLEPIKEKYGTSLSWGDLIILSGNVAIESMGGKTLGFCGGRIDDADGSDSLKLGPSPEQEAIAPCVSVDKDGQCLDVEGTALGTGTVGLIYVNPGGPVGFEGDRTASAEDIRRVFGTGMSFDERETVAIVGGGHAFGKAHGACPTPPCGNGKGNNTFTSGFEGAWTSKPDQWDNEFFRNLFDYNWELVTGPGGSIQWAPMDEGAPDIMMLTSDLALAVDPVYKAISMEYYNSVEKLEEDFAKAWYKLTTADMGPSERCIGENVPEPQLFQSDLPAAPSTLPDYVPVRARIQELLEEDPSNKVAFIDLAYKCASTFRQTDYFGGCNGARIRFAPESEWPENAGTQDVIQKLEPIQQEFSDVSFADVIVLAGQTALESESDLTMTFCGGRVDASEAIEFGKDLSPRIYSDPLVTVMDDMLVKGLSNEEGIALMSRGDVGSQYYKDLLSGEGDFSSYELAVLNSDELKAIVVQFANDEAVLVETFEGAWTKMMTADRFLGNNGNACVGVDTKTLDDDGDDDGLHPGAIAGIAAAAALALMLLFYVVWSLFHKKASEGDEPVTINSKKETIVNPQVNTSDSDE